MRRIFEPAGLLVRGWRIRGFEFVVRFMSIDHMDDSAFLYVRSIKRDPVREAMSLPVNWGAGAERRSGASKHASLDPPSNQPQTGCQGRPSSAPGFPQVLTARRSGTMPT
jgi:hypothetical protein